MISSVKWWAVALICCTAAFAPANANAEYPDRPIHLVVGFSAGGNTDFMARLIASELSQELGQSVVVENRTGAEGMIAEEYVAHADPDGYTLAYIINSHTIAGSLRELNFDPITSLAPISLIESHANVLVVSPSIGVNSLQEFVDLAKAKPGELNFGSTGAGGPPFLFMALLMKRVGLDMVNVTYQGTSPTILAILGGEIQAAWGSVETVSEHIKAGKVTAIAVSTNVRSSALPDVPTVAEALNLPDFDERVWQGIAAPAGTPKEIIQKLHMAISAVLKKPEVAEQFNNRGYSAIGSTPEEFETFIANEQVKWKEILKTVNVK